MRRGPLHYWRRLRRRDQRERCYQACRSLPAQALREHGEAAVRGKYLNNLKEDAAAFEDELNNQREGLLATRRKVGDKGCILQETYVHQLAQRDELRSVQMISIAPTASRSSHAAKTELQSATSSSALLLHLGLQTPVPKPLQRSTTSSSDEQPTAQSSTVAQRQEEQARMWVGATDIVDVIGCVYWGTAGSEIPRTMPRPPNNKSGLREKQHMIDGYFGVRWACPETKIPVPQSGLKTSLFNGLHYNF